MKTIQRAITNFTLDTDGAQVVEYAMIIAVVSIALVLALGDSTEGISSKLADLVTRIGACMSSGTC